MASNQHAFGFLKSDCSFCEQPIALLINLRSWMTTPSMPGQWTSVGARFGFLWARHTLDSRGKCSDRLCSRSLRPRDRLSGGAQDPHAIVCNCRDAVYYCVLPTATDTASSRMTKRNVLTWLHYPGMWLSSQHCRGGDLACKGSELNGVREGEVTAVPCFPHKYGSSLFWSCLCYNLG
jgi:hypothetical protein